MSPRAMRPWRSIAVVCPVCGKAIRSDEPVTFADGAYRHAVNCTAPLRRRPKG
jgi:hypothetical protein